MSRQPFLRRIASRLRREAADVRLMGVAGRIKLQFHRFGRSDQTVRLAGVGAVTLRPGGSDLASFRNIFAERQYEVPVPAVQAAIEARYSSIVAAGRTPVIVDAGAYVGAASLWFRSLYPQSHIVALEPQPDNFALLKRNLAHCERVTAVEAAVGVVPGHVEIVDSPELWATRTHRSQQGVRVTTMNEAYAQVPEGEPFLAKVNVEGFEEEIFSDALEWLDRITILFIEPHDWLLPGRHTSRSFQKALGDRDFHLFIVGPHLCYVRL